MIVAPVLAHLAGLGADALAPTLVELADADDRAAAHHWHRLVRLDGPGRCSLVSMRSSGDVPAAARATGFVTVPPETPTDELAHHPYRAWTL